LGKNFCDANRDGVWAYKTYAGNYATIKRLCDVYKRPEIKGIAPTPCSFEFCDDPRLHHNWLNYTEE